MKSAIAMVAVLAAFLPLTAMAAAAPDPVTLRQSLADPVDSGFVEAEIGTQGTLEGPFSANQYVDYWRASGASEADVRGMQNYLARDRFAGGYGRQWYRPGAAEVMGELVMVFQDNSGALASSQASKLRYGEDRGFRAFVNSGLNKDSFAATVSLSGYDWTVAVFVKGNALYAVSRGSQDGYMTASTLKQARRAYNNAPAGFSLTSSQQPALGLAQNLRLFLILGFVLLLALVALVGAVIILQRSPSSQPDPAVEVTK